MERDAFEPGQMLLSLDFNSHAHVERDGCAWSIDHRPVISTHTLTWSVTLTIDYGDGVQYISTHTLTWSVT